MPVRRGEETMERCGEILTSCQRSRLHLLLNGQEAHELREKAP